MYRNNSVIRYTKITKILGKKANQLEKENLMLIKNKNFPWIIFLIIRKVMIIYTILKQ